MTLSTNAGPLTVEIVGIERITGTGGRRREGMAGWILGKVSLLRVGSGLGGLLVEYAEDTCNCLVVNDSLVVFTDHVDTKLLI